MKKLKRNGDGAQYELTYTRDVNPNTFNPYILVASRIKGGRMALWSIHIEERNGTLELKVGQLMGWMSFAEVPDFYRMLSEPAMRLQNRGGIDLGTIDAGRHTLDSIQAWLVDHNYKRFS